MYFGKAESSDNKKGFDLVSAHKSEIEEALGINLTWDRGDDKKSSKIFYKIDGVGIDKEDDWQTIARFHAKWTVKFYEVIVKPYLLPEYVGK